MLWDNPLSHGLREGLIPIPVPAVVGPGRGEAAGKDGQEVRDVLEKLEGCKRGCSAR